MPVHPAADVLGSRAPAGRYFAKAPVYLPAGTGPVTVAVLGRTPVTLAWVPGYLWTNPRRQYDVTDFQTRRLTFEGCDGAAATYLGGVLSTRPAGCAELGITTPRHPPRRVTVAFGRAGCER